MMFFVTSCVNQTFSKKEDKDFETKNFLNKGFALVYNDNLFKKKIIKGKIENRSLILFQRDLKKNSSVKITNLKNSKYLIAKVGSNIEYPSFYNSVISSRIAKQLEIDEFEPYVEIKIINNNNTFVAKKAKTFDEEKNVADNAPIDLVSVNNLNDSPKKTKEIVKVKFKYIIKIADFYFLENAKVMVNKVKNQTEINDVKVKEISKNQYRVFLGPFDNLNSLKKVFNGISVLKFENIEFIKK